MKMRRIGAAAGIATALAFGAVHPASTDQFPLPETATVLTGLGWPVSLVVGGDCSTGYTVTLSMDPADPLVYIQLAEATGDVTDPIGSLQTPITWLIGSSGDGVAEENAPGGVIWTGAPLSIPAIFGVNASDYQFNMGTNFPVEGEVEAPPCSTPTPTATPTLSPTATPTPAAIPTVPPTATPTPTAAATGIPAATPQVGQSASSGQPQASVGGQGQSAPTATPRATAATSSTDTPTATPSPTGDDAVIAPATSKTGTPPPDGGIAWWVVTLLVVAVVVVAGSATGAFLRRSGRWGTRGSGA
jgi:hypothetical protein